MFRSIWSYVLLVIIIADSLLTYYIGGERNPVILFTMDKLGLSLGWAMIIRVFYCLPLVLIIDRFKHKMSIWALILYLMIYFWFLI
jgi:hypothetical protein